MSDINEFKVTVKPEGVEDTSHLGIRKITFTKRPAVQIKGLAFADEQEEKELFFADDLKYRIAGPVSVPMASYRKPRDGDEEYNAVFEIEEIEEILKEFMSDPDHLKNLFDKEHIADDTVDAYILEIWIVADPETDKSYTSYGIKVPAGTIFAVIQFRDIEEYNTVVANGQEGLSLQGKFALELKMSEEENGQTEESKQLPTNSNMAKSKVTSKTEKLSFAKVDKINKWEMEVENTSFAVGDKVTRKDENGESFAIGDGEYQLEDGSRILLDANGVIQLVMPKDGEKPVEEKPEADGEKVEMTDEEKAAAEKAAADKKAADEKELKEAEEDKPDGEKPVEDKPAETGGEVVTMEMVGKLIEEKVKPMIAEAMKTIVETVVDGEDKKEAGTTKTDEKDMAYNAEERLSGVANFLAQGRKK